MLLGLAHQKQLLTALENSFKLCCAALRKNKFFCLASLIKCELALPMAFQELSRKAA